MRPEFESQSRKGGGGEAKREDFRWTTTCSIKSVLCPLCSGKRATPTFLRSKSWSFFVESIVIEYRETKKIQNSKFFLLLFFILIFRVSKRDQTLNGHIPKGLCIYSILSEEEEKTTTTTKREANKRETLLPFILFFDDDDDDDDGSGRVREWSRRSEPRCSPKKKKTPPKKRLGFGRKGFGGAKTTTTTGDEEEEEEEAKIGLPP